MKVRTAQKRESIVDAAAELFAEMGYERASMSELVKRLGGSKATLYGYFASKEALFEAVVRAAATSHLSEGMQELSLASVESRETLESALLQFAEGLLLVTQNDDRALAVYRMVIAESGHSDVGKLFHESGPRQSMEALANFMAAAMDRGILRRADPEVTSQQFTALVTAEVQLRLYQRNPPRLAIKQIRRMAKCAVDTFFAGAAPR
jgi:AcrR family transcriptional regulator